MNEAVAACEGDAVGVADSGTWGFVRFEKACKKFKKKPIYGFSCSVFDTIKEERGGGAEFTILAKTVEGLRTIYKLVSLANKQFYYIPRLLYTDIRDASGDDIIIIAGSGADAVHLQSMENVYLGVHPSNTSVWINNCINSGLPIVAVSDVYYTRPEDADTYETFINDYKKTGAQYICNEELFKALIVGWQQSWFDNTHVIADSIEHLQLPKAQNVKFNSKKTLEELCRDGIKDRPIVWDDVYEARLMRELEMIKLKDFEDYFFVLSDLIINAKKKMLVGPARGSSAGSLVCYLTQITDVDPIKFDLIFERFIDITRADLPDIDVDFPDLKRKSVIKYLEAKYGEDCVAHVGTVSEYKPRSALGELGKKLSIGFTEMNSLKDSIIERNAGDERANNCIEDTLATTDFGQLMLEKYPAIAIAGKIEGHARHTGMHAAGMIVLNNDIRNYASVGRDGAAMIDKKDAEYLNILKIDALGLRTLSVLEDCMHQINLTREKLLEVPLNDEKAFDVFNKGYYAGIFQFEGQALQNLNRAMPVEQFEDIVAITTIARPGPLQSGGAAIFTNRRTGKEPVVHLHPLAEPFTKHTFGVLIYQEQIMYICRAIGNMSWEEVSALRKIMGKTLGKESFNSYWEKFRDGAASHEISEQKAQEIWDTMCTFGAYAFNRSHSVSYALISYWCAWLKANYPLEFAVACLRNSKDDSQTIKLLRELVKEGYKYVAFDRHLSAEDWTVQKGVLYGGLIGAKGVGATTAANIVRKRSTGEAFTPSQEKALAYPEVAYDDVFKCKTKFGDCYADPSLAGVTSGTPISHICDIGVGLPIFEYDGKTIKGYKDQVFLFIGELKEKQLVDLNDASYVAKRNGELMEKGKNLFLKLTFADDTDEIACSISRFYYNEYGKAINDHGKVGSYYLIKGVVKNGWRKIHINNIKLLDG